MIFKKKCNMPYIRSQSSLVVISTPIYSHRHLKAQGRFKKTSLHLPSVYLLAIMFTMITLKSLDKHKTNCNSP